MSHTYAATSAALHSTSHGYLFLFAFSGCEFSGLRAWLPLLFVQRLGCHSCKQSQSVINHQGRIEPCPFPTEVTGRSAHAGPGREWIHPPGRLQHPALTLILWVLFCPRPHQHPRGRGTFPALLGQMCSWWLPASSPRCPQRRGWSRGCGRGWQRSGQAGS